MFQSTDFAIIAILLMLVILGIVGNTLVCVIIIKHRDMRLPINYLLMNLAVADIMFATFIAPGDILEQTSSHPDGLTGTVLCSVLTCGNLAWVGSASSAITLVSIAIKRHHAVQYPHRHKGYLSTRKLKVIIPGSWIFSLIINLPLFLVVNVNNKKKRSTDLENWAAEWIGKAYGITWFVLAVALLALTVVLYSRVVCTLWFKRNGNSHLTHQQLGLIKVRKRVTLMAVSVSIIFGMCWITTTAECMLSQFNIKIFGASSNVICHLLVMFNSTVNPLLYSLLNHKFKKKFKGIFRCSTCWPILRVQAATKQSNEIKNNQTEGPCSRK